MGGGTFDVSLVKINGKNIEVLGTAGDNHLGGEDFDNTIVGYCVAEFKKDIGVDLSKNQKALIKIKTAAEKAKKQLSST